MENRKKRWVNGETMGWWRTGQSLSSVLLCIWGFHGGRKTESDQMWSPSVLQLTKNQHSLSFPIKQSMENRLFETRDSPNIFLRHNYSIYLSLLKVNVISTDWHVFFNTFYYCNIKYQLPKFKIMRNLSVRLTKHFVNIKKK